MIRRAGNEYGEGSMARGRPAGLRLETADRRQVEFQQSCRTIRWQRTSLQAHCQRTGPEFLRNTVGKNFGARIKKDVAPLVHNLR